MAEIFAAVFASCLAEELNNAAEIVDIATSSKVIFEMPSV